MRASSVHTRCGGEVQAIRQDQTSFSLVFQILYHLHVYKNRTVYAPLMKMIDLSILSILRFPHN